MKDEIKIGSLVELVEEVVTGWKIGTIAEVITVNNTNVPYELSYKGETCRTCAYKVKLYKPEPEEQKEENEEPFFKTQQEIWEYLVASEGNKVVDIKYGSTIIGFKDGKQFAYKGIFNDFTFDAVTLWKPYVEPPAKKWWELNNNKPTLCYYGDYFNESGTLPFIGVVVRQGAMFRLTTGTVTWEHAIPVPKEEAHKFIFGEQDDKD